MSKVRTVAAVGISIAVPVVCGVSLGTAETVFDEVSDDYIEDLDFLNYKQKKFLKVSSRVGAKLVSHTAAFAIGSAAGTFVRKVVLKA